MCRALAPSCFGSLPSLVQLPRMFVELFATESPMQIVAPDIACQPPFVLSMGVRAYDPATLAWTNRGRSAQQRVLRTPLRQDAWGWCDRECIPAGAVLGFPCVCVCVRNDSLGRSHGIWAKRFLTSSGPHKLRDIKRASLSQTSAPRRTSHHEACESSPRLLRVSCGLARVTAPSNPPLDERFVRLRGYLCRTISWRGDVSTSLAQTWRAQTDERTLHLTCKVRSQGRSSVRACARR